MEYNILVNFMVWLLCIGTVSLTTEDDLKTRTVWSEETPGVILEVDKVNSVTVTSIETATLKTNCLCDIASDCIGNRTITDSTCSCREVCAAQSGEPCSLSQPCDVEFGLRCEVNICQGKLQIQILEITYNFISLRWRSSNVKSPQVIVSIASVYNGSDTKWKQVQVNNGEVKIQDLTPNTNYFVKVEEDGEFEIAVIKTKEKPLNKSRKILVTHRSPNSLTLAWDDYKTTNHQPDYNVEYRAVGTHRGWTTHKTGTIPATTIGNLKPRTDYDVRVSVWLKDGSGEDVSDVISAMTDDGCIRDNVTYQVGDEFFEGCDLRCVCTGSDLGECEERCKDPYFRPGTKLIDPMCQEVSLLDDLCCVISSCSLNSTNTSAIEETESCKYKEILYSPGDIFYDGCDYKCNCTEEGEIVCEPRCADQPQNNSSGCDIIPDPMDTCCKITICEINLEEMAEGSTMATKTKSSVLQNSKIDKDEYYREPKMDKGQSTTENPVTWDTNFDLKISKERHFKQHSNKLQNTLKQMHVKATNVTSDREPEAIEENVDTNVDQEIPRRFSGCEFKNQTYKSGEEFFDGCDAKCICEGTGHISCLPRCPLFASAGNTCQELPDPVDLCCTIMACKPPGDLEVLENLENLSLKIQSVDAQNATTIKLRLVLLEDNESTEPVLQLWYLPVSSSSVSWTKRILRRNELIPIKKNVYDVMFSDLSPNTEYYVRVIKMSEGVEIGDDNDASTSQSMFSNTVSVKTFAAAIDTVFQGCFHHNKTYDVGEVFYDGCQYKCVCHKGGQFECQDRCDIYIDTIGFENCYWGPSSEDPCCIIPHCNKTTEINESFCILDNGDSHKAGDSWETKEGCIRKICQCVLYTNGTTGIQCKGGCPPIPSKAHLPTADCPNPQLVTPDDPCLCPYIVCSTVLNMTPEPPPMCKFNNKLYDVGKEFYDGCKAVCHCGEDLKVSCATIECPHHFPSRQSECLEWEIDADFVPSPPNCCPVDAKCKNNGSCELNGMRILNYEEVPGNMLDCGTRCICMNGNVTCENKCPKVEDFPPTDLPCPYSFAYKGQDEDKCCIRWMCRDADRKEEAECHYQGKSYRPGERWEVRTGSIHRLCTCKIRSNGRTTVECLGGCPPIPARYREPTPQCARPVLITPDDPVICPYVVCNNSVSGNELQNVNIISVNSSTVKIEFTLPSLFVGLTGQTEAYFTTNPSLPRDLWQIQKFSTPNRLFKFADMEYYLSGLSADMTYFFQIKTIIDGIQGGLESDLYKLRMPQALPTTTTTTTTTLPPMIMLDATMVLTPLDSKTLKVTWRNFEPQEKRFINGIQVRYKPKNSLEDSWKSSPMIHRDVTSYMIHNMIPNTEYDVELVFREESNIPTKLVSAKVAEVKLPPVPKDEYDFQVSVRQEKTDSESTQLSLSGVPTPLIKYVHLAKVMLKGETDHDILTVFKIPKTDRITLKELKPSKRYKVWLELYLTNGKTLTSNVIEITTKEDVAINTIDTKAVKAKLSESPTTSRMEEETRAYYVALIVVAVIAAAAGFGFILLLIILLKRQATDKAAITRAPSESAYDNPTFKPQDTDKLDDKNSLHP